MRSNHIIVSCAFGAHIEHVYPAVQGFRSVFFSNNAALKNTAREKGWEFKLLNKFSLSDDEMISSLQAKYVKFLQFLNDSKEYDDVTSVTYHDHKFFVEREHLNWIFENCSPNADLLIRNTPREKLTIADEIADAMPQERYRRHMPETLAFLEQLGTGGLISQKVRIVNTGLIHYQCLSSCRAYLKSVFDACMSLSQPECQIIWAALSQMSDVRIQRVHWDSLKPLWQAPC